MRVYIWARYETTSKNYTLYFLLAKNFLTVVFLAKKIVNIVLEEMPKRTKVNANESYTDMSDKAAWTLSVSPFVFIFFIILFEHWLWINIYYLFI